ncbi:MAG: LysR substrate-binding domain-containing protein [Ideonella sp.]
MRNLDLSLLRTLVTIASTGTFSGAARKLYKTQSAVTQQMQRLEELISLPLFEKEGRKKRLSPHGQRLVEYSRQMLAINDDAVRALEDGQLEGTISLGASADVADTMLPSVLTHIARSSPRIKIEIRVDRSPFLMDALRHGEIDLAISTRFDQNLQGVVLRTSPTVWICSANYVYDATAPLPLILADEPSIFRRLALNALEPSRLRWRTNYLAPNLVGIRAAVRAGLGVTARSIELLGPDMRVLGAAEGLPPLPDITYYLWTRRDPIMATTQQVYEMLKTNMGLNESIPVSR